MELGRPNTYGMVEHRLPDFAVLPAGRDLGGQDIPVPKDRVALRYIRKFTRLKGRRDCHLSVKLCHSNKGDFLCACDLLPARVDRGDVAEGGCPHESIAFSSTRPLAIS